MTPQAFRIVRRTLGISQKDAARIIGVDKTTLCRFEQGGRHIADAKLKPLADAMARKFLGDIIGGDA